MYSGIITGTLAMVATAPGPSLAHGVTAYVIALGAAAPTFAQPFVQKRWFKIPSRFLLGIGFALCGSTFWLLPQDVDGWLLRTTFVGVTAILYRAATALRARRSANPCVGCPWGSFPLCTHNLAALRRLAADPTLPDGERAFFRVMSAQLAPLATVPPSMNGPRPTSPSPDVPVAVNHLPF